MQARSLLRAPYRALAAPSVATTYVYGGHGRRLRVTARTNRLSHLCDAWDRTEPGIHVLAPDRAHPLSVGWHGRCSSPPRMPRVADPMHGPAVTVAARDNPGRP